MSQPQTGFVYLDISQPLVAWLAYRGEMVSAPQTHKSALSIWAAGRLRDRRRYEKEVALEKIRSARFPETVSRLTGFYVFPDKAAAESAALRWHLAYFRPEALVEVGIMPGSRVSKYDSEWITHYFDGDTSGWIPSYFQGEPTVSPIWEYVVDGRALIYGTDLRNSAHDVAVKAWPRSKCLLELARLGAWLESDLGLITAMLFGDATGLRVRYAMNFEDAKNPEFLERLKNFDGPKNAADLYPFEIVVPDLRGIEFTLS